MRWKHHGATSRLSAAAIAATLLGGCYLTHGRGDPAGRDAGRGLDAGRRDGGALRDSATPRDAIALPDAGDDSCRGRWEITAELQLTEPPGDKRLSDAVWTGSGYLVGFQAGFASGPPFAQLVRFGAPAGAPQRVFGPPSMSYGPMAIAVSGSTVAALRWDSIAGCLFRRLAPDGTGVAVERRIDGRECRGFTGARRGFYLMDNPDAASGVRFHRLDGDGGSIGRIPRLEIFGDFYSWHTRVPFDDDSQLLVVLRDSGGVVSAAAQRIDGDGRPAAAQTALPIVGFTNMQSLATADGALIGWLEDDGEDPEERVIRLLRTSRDGILLGEPVTVPGARASWSGGWSMTRLRGEIFLVYVERVPGDPSGRETVVRAQRIDDRGAPRGGPLHLADAISAQQVIARTNESNVFVGYSAGDAPSRDVFALRLECVVP